MEKVCYVLVKSTMIITDEDEFEEIQKGCIDQNIGAPYQDDEIIKVFKTKEEALRLLAIHDGWVGKPVSNPKALVVCEYCIKEAIAKVENEIEPFSQILRFEKTIEYGEIQIDVCDSKTGYIKSICNSYDDAQWFIKKSEGRNEKAFIKYRPIEEQ